MSQQVIPYTYHAPTVQTSIAGLQGVVINLYPENLAMAVATFQSWFEDREDVLFVDQGTTDKQGTGFLIMEWAGYEIDRLFLDILAKSDFIEDFVVYVREETD